MAEDYCSQNGLIYADDTVVKQKWESTTEAFSQPLNLVSACLTRNKLTINYEKKQGLINMKARRKSSQQQLMIREKNLTQK